MCAWIALGAGCPGIADLRTETKKRDGFRTASDTVEFDRSPEAAGLPAFWNVKRGPEPQFTATVLSSPGLSGSAPAAESRTEADPERAIRFGVRQKRACYSDPANGEKRSGKDAADVKIYLESLWLYLALPLQLALAPRARTGACTLPEASGPEDASRRLPRLFVSPGGAAPSPDRDQYVLWTDPRNDRVAFAEFTCREVFDFYSGALFFDDYRRTADFWLPFTTKITNGIDETDSVHTIQVESVRVVPAPLTAPGAGSLDIP